MPLRLTLKQPKGSEKGKMMIMRLKKAIWKVQIIWIMTLKTKKTIKILKKPSRSRCIVVYRIQNKSNEQATITVLKTEMLLMSWTWMMNKTMTRTKTMAIPSCLPQSALYHPSYSTVRKPAARSSKSNLTCTRSKLWK